MTNKGNRQASKAVSALIVVLMTALIVSCDTSSAEDNPAASEQDRNAEVVRDAFALGVGSDEGFFEILADDVQWTVARAEGERTYTSRSEFLRDGAGPVQARLRGPIQAEVRQLIAQDDVVVAIWDGTATAVDGGPYFNRYAWVMTMRDEQVVRGTAFLDLVAMNEFLQRVNPS